MEKEPAREATGKASKTPLYMKLYFQEVYMDIARMVGYAGKPLAETRAALQELGKKYDKEKLVKASEELVDISAEFVTLKANVRKLCFQLLGPAPEQQETFNKGRIKSDKKVVS